MSVPSDAELFRTIFHTTSQCMWVVEPDGTLRDVNQAALAGSGVTAAAVVGRPFWDGPWWSMLPATQARLRSAIARAVEGGPVQTEVVVGGEVEQVLTLDCSIKPIRDAAGTVPLLLVEGRDITAAKQAERERDHSVDRVQQVEAALRAHEQRLAIATSAAELGVFEWNLAEPLPSLEPARGVTDTFPACHMLLVEDTEDARALITAVSEERCRVTAVSSMQEAQAAIQDLLDTLGQTFDAVLIDINLGGGPSGLDLLAALRTHPAYRTVPMAAVTAYALPGDRERFLAAGFDAYLSKPFTADDLLAVLAQLLPG